MMTDDEFHCAKQIRTETAADVFDSETGYQVVM